MVHSHSPSVIPFGVVDVPFRPVCHTCGFLTGRTPVFEIRSCAGLDSDLLIRNGGLGAALAQCMGEHNVSLMRGHGVTVAGSTVQEAVFRSVYTEINAKLLSQALALSPNVTYLTDEEARAVDTANMGQLSRVWDLWVRDL